MKKFTAIAVIAAVPLVMASCAGMTNQESRTKEGVIVGAGLGAILGQAIGGDTEGTLIGAGLGAAIGGVAGNQIGAYMDRQEQALRSAVATSEAASIQRSQNVLTATFKANTFFDFDSSTLKPGAYSELDRVAKVLRDFPQTRIRVEGHTDSKGTDQYNMLLSQRRAQAVTDALVQRGVDPMRMESIGFGESQPVSSNDGDNRRVNIVIIPVQS
ncbi:OmpF [Desulforapulum autotrophicum HRM2]|jgi:outer membrane protein OmpA-like peptidoglycan-associated protein|uniref:OmpF n=1 Tax=Desulforapulum autotrophicum (strain ATCC 43914 / DSM 3382 / VKM B-1955 / HRM2) TaxID=177437 RepID=C0QAM7_DESAH|nr:OmpA family protein [Desulforapulum autotrophicum]ACN16810.1 OmpF [Desulforapulum autotrophicum HRM2]